MQKEGFARGWLWLLSFAFISTLACSTSKTGISTTNFIKLESSSCMTGCKEFTLTVDNKGTCLLRGSKSIQMPGNYQSKLSKQDNASFWKTINNYRLDTLKDKYDFEALDTQLKVLTLCKKGKSKEIYYKYMVPKVLDQFTQTMESLIKQNTWEQITTKK